MLHKNISSVLKLFRSKLKAAMNLTKQSYFYLFSIDIFIIVIKGEALVLLCAHS